MKDGDSQTSPFKTQMTTQRSPESRSVPRLQPGPGESPDGARLMSQYAKAVHLYQSNGGGSGSEAHLWKNWIGLRHYPPFLKSIRKASPHGLTRDAINT